MKNIIVGINNEFSKKKFEYFKATENMYETAKNNKFYLGLKLDKELFTRVVSTYVYLYESNIS